MKTKYYWLGVLFLALMVNGCVVHEHSHRRHSPGPAYHQQHHHVHGPGCGHVLRGEIWIPLP